MRLTVVKLGGSHVFSPLLRPWLTAIEGAAGHVVLVPGGGPFAETVRAAQAALDFDDRVAHHMALLAMVQYGLALASLGTCLELAGSWDAMLRIVAEGRVPVWSPAAMLRDALDVPQTWDVTSDSLAVWLAGAIAAPQVLLVKHRPAPGDVPAERLAADGLVDRAFTRFLAGYKGDVFFAGPDDLPDAALDPHRLPGTRILAHAAARP